MSCSSLPGSHRQPRRPGADWDGFFLFLLLGLLYAVAGFLTIEHPLLAAESLSLMLAVLFLLVGLFRIALALVDHLPAWGWVLFNGVVTVLLAVATWRLGPRSGVRVLSMLVGIELIVNGVTWSMLAVGAQRAGSVERSMTGRYKSCVTHPRQDRDCVADSKWGHSLRMYVRRDECLRSSHGTLRR